MNMNLFARRVDASMATEIRKQVAYGSLLKPTRGTPREKRTKARDQRPGMSDAHLDLIRSLPCCACGAQPRSEAHHLLQTGTRGMGLRSPDKYTVPLCTACHTDLHGNGSRREASWFAQHGIHAPVVLALGLWDCRGNPERMPKVVEAHRDE